MEALNALKSKYLNAVSEAVDETSLEDLRVAAVGKKGEVSLKMRELGKMSPEERKIAGPALNALKDEINSALLAKKVALSDAALNDRLQNEWLDVSMAGRPRRRGSLHPISQVTEEIIAIFASLGFSVADRTSFIRGTAVLWNIYCNFNSYSSLQLLIFLLTKH